MPKALVLFSGGLDSLLAARMLQEQPGLEVEAIHFISLFTANEAEDSADLPARKSARDLGMPLIVEQNSEALLELVKAPRYGLGRHMNPCIDCRIRNVRRAVEVMREIGADFLASGEVVGERPMSQNRGALRLVEKQSGCEGLLLRPLSAKLLAPTIPEQRGWVNRDDMLDFSGRGRKPQMALARHYGIHVYPSPAGGCLLTDPNFGARMRDLLEHDPDCDLNDCALLKVGRHLRLGPDTMLVVGRNQEENDVVAELAREGDVFVEAATHPGPLSLLRGKVSDADIELAGAITARYGKASGLPEAEILVRAHDEGRDAGRRIDVVPATDETVAPLWIVPERKGKGGRRAAG